MSNAPQHYGSISTKFLGPTDHKGDRVKAWQNDGMPGRFGMKGTRFTTIIPFKSETQPTESHFLAASLVGNRIKAWHEKTIGVKVDRIEWIAKTSVNDNGYVFLYKIVYVGDDTPGSVLDAR